MADISFSTTVWWHSKLWEGFGDVLQLQLCHKHSTKRYKTTVTSYVIMESDRLPQPL